MANQFWRKEIFERVDIPWDIIVIGGGISGAGIFREACRIGLKTLLVEQRDFAWGTSSRSSKLVHGGLRYLKDGHFMLTRAAVMERERLLDEGPGLIDPLGFLHTIYNGDFPGRWTYEAGLSIYDLLALQWGHRYYSADDLNFLAPHISRKNLKGGFQFNDAQTDDARLVFRLIQEAVSGGGTAVNYVKADGLLLDPDRVKGVKLLDLESGRRFKVYGKVVVNATGVWVDKLRSTIVPSNVVRPLRGSHLIFPSWRLPVAQAISFLHPYDHRPVFIFPWEGVTIVGTTDVDHEQSLDMEPAINPYEVSYLMAAVETQFPSLNIDLDDITSTFAGIRPVIGTGKKDPSQESRDHFVWADKGLITVTGGKLTTFRLLALEVLEKVRHRIPDMPPTDTDYPVLNVVQDDITGFAALNLKHRRRLIGRYGDMASQVIEIAMDGELNQIPGTNHIWAEVRWAAKFEYVCHLDDLLLRRLRLGLVLPNGGKEILLEAGRICQQELLWGDERWEEEKSNYLNTWKSRYYLTAVETIPDWKTFNRGKKIHQVKNFIGEMDNVIPKRRIFGVVLFLAAGIGLFVWLREQRRR